MRTVVSSGGLLIEPNSITLDRDGNILVTNLNGGDPSLPGNIVRVDPVSGAQTPAYSGAPFAFSEFQSVAPNGDLYATNIDNTLAGNAQVLCIPTNADRNIISGNTGNGITITGSGASGNVVAGNYVGTNAAGTAALGNGLTTALPGIILEVGSNNNTVGGTTAAARNVIAANGSQGLRSKCMSSSLIRSGKGRAPAGRHPDDCLPQRYPLSSP